MAESDSLFRICKNAPATGASPAALASGIAPTVLHTANAAPSAAARSSCRFTIASLPNNPRGISTPQNGTSGRLPSGTIHASASPRICSSDSTRATSPCKKTFGKRAVGNVLSSNGMGTVCERTLSNSSNARRRNAFTADNGTAAGSAVATAENGVPPVFCKAVIKRSASKTLSIFGAT